MGLKQPEEECPICLTDLRGAVIPGTEPPLYYSHLIGVKIPNLYDGVLFWECPFCQGKIHRFRKGTAEWRKADFYV